MIEAAIYYLTRTKIYSFIVLNIIPNIRLSVKYPKMNGHKFNKIQNNIKNGTILLQYDNAKLSTYFIPGKWNHAAIYFNGYIYEMLTGGINKTTLFDFCKQCDDVLPLWSYKFDIDYINKMAEMAENLYAKNIKYDEQFSEDDIELYCSELIVYLDFENRLNIPKTKSLGMEYYSPSNLAESFDLIPII